MKTNKLIIVLIFCIIVVAIGAFVSKSGETPTDGTDLVTEVETLPSGRYVKVTATEAISEDKIARKEWIIVHLSELEVLDESGENIAKGKPVTGSSEWPDTHRFPRLTDGVISSEDDRHDDNFASTHGTEEPRAHAFMTIDLGEEKEIKTIKLHNRTSCCGERAIGLKVEILDESKQIVKETPVISSDSKDYTFTFLTDTDWRIP